MGESRKKGGKEAKVLGKEIMEDKAEHAGVCHTPVTTGPHSNIGHGVASESEMKVCWTQLQATFCQD